MIKIGIAVGSMAWGSYNSTDYRTSGMVVQGNTFTVRVRIAASHR